VADAFRMLVRNMRNKNAGNQGSYNPVHNLTSTMIVEKSSQVTGNVGLYYVCYQLAKRGWNVMPTSRNARSVDVIIYNHDARGIPSRSRH
jgi:hypothetical protein